MEAAPPTAVVFDFDLTLVDSSEGVVECANHALAALGFEAADAKGIRRTIGLTLPQSFRALTGVTDAELESNYSRHYVARADEVMVSMTHFYPGVPATLATLRSRGIRSGIVSTKFRYRIESILAHAGLENAVDVIVGGEDVKQHKPHPEGLLYALQCLDVDPSCAVYVGDHPVDAETAARAGTAFVAVRTGVAPLETWNACRPLGVIADVGELGDLLDGAGRR